MYDCKVTLLLIAAGDTGRENGKNKAGSFAGHNACRYHRLPAREEMFAIIREPMA